MSADLDFGSLNQVLERSSAARNLASWDKNLVKAETLGETQNLMRSAGPVSDAYILGADPFALLNGPGGSGKTVASAKKALVSAQRMIPNGTRDGKPLRRYVLGVWRQKYQNLWSATIPSWWEVFPKDLPGSSWTGASPRSATHVLRFEDAYGIIEMIAMFEAFGDSTNPEDMLGKRFTDAYMNELTTFDEALPTALADRVGRDPPPSVTKRAGRFFADCNAPDVTDWVYRDFFEDPKPGKVLYRQPSGLAPDAENPAITRAYYENTARMNADKPWHVRRMVHNIPGMTRGERLVYPTYDDERMLSPTTIEVYPQLPVLVGVDGGMTPAAVYAQEMGDGQMRWLAEIAMERAGMEELGRAMLALEAARFQRCEFVTDCDPSMVAGEGDEERPDLEHGSDRQRLARALGRKVELASTNEPTRRQDAVRDKLNLNLGPNRPGFLLDPSCKGLRRGFLQTFRFRQIRGSTEIGNVVKSFESHVHEAGQYTALRSGTAEARKRRTELEADRRRAREAAREKQGRYNPLRRTK